MNCARPLDPSGHIRAAHHRHGRPNATHLTGRSTPTTRRIQSKGLFTPMIGPSHAPFPLHTLDLTLLAKQNGGVFPMDRLYRTIEGRDLPEG